MTATPCDSTYLNDVVEPALQTARTWRVAARRWLATYLDHLRARARTVSASGYTTVGTTILNELRLLNEHFHISATIARMGGIFPLSSGEQVSVRDLERFGQAIYDIRRAFGDVDLSGLSFQCQDECPRGRTGSDVLGSAHAGSHEVTLYRRCFDVQAAETKAGVVLHEAFHASFAAFDHDTYSFEGTYPGRAAQTNAESYTMFAAIVATGRTYRIILLPEMHITGSPTP